MGKHKTVLLYESEDLRVYRFPIENNIYKAITIVISRWSEILLIIILSILFSLYCFTTN
jgi:hypothetical protein